MKFSNSSDVSLVITSCDRFDLLKRTIDSFDKFNDYPIKQVIITEDSGKNEVKQCIPDAWKEHTTFIVNNPKLGQMKSIDAAYALLDSEYIFHCEDDWEFYREGFIGESKQLLINDPQALQVWLRSYAHDLKVHSPYVYQSERKEFAHIPFYQVMSHKADWQGFSFNPGLRRLKDYQKYAPYAEFSGEKQLSKLYADANRYALILENDAVLHTGFGSHVVVADEKVKKSQRKKREKAKNIIFFVLGLVVMSIINVF